jgi:hypothetical protein
MSMADVLMIGPTGDVTSVDCQVIGCEPRVPLEDTGSAYESGSTF